MENKASSAPLNKDNDDSLPLMVHVTAPASLAAGYTFEAEINGDPDKVFTCEVVRVFLAFSMLLFTSDWCLFIFCLYYSLTLVLCISINPNQHTPTHSRKVESKKARSS